MTGNGCKLGIIIPLLGILVTLSGCVRTIVQPVLPCPPRPVLESISVEEQAGMDPAVIFKVSESMLKLKAYAKKLEVRAGCE
jgi:hypothetical protein